jgi:hypothetical protein
VSEQLGVEGRHHVRGSADALRFADQALSHQVDEVGDVGVDRPAGALRVIWRLGGAVDVAAGDAGGSTLPPEKRLPLAAP